MPKKYELRLVVRKDNDFQVSADMIESDTIIELLSQFQIVIAKSLIKEHAHEILQLKEKYIDDDIPF